MSTRIKIRDPEVEKITKSLVAESSTMYLYLADNISFVFDDRDEALSFFEQGRDMILEKEGDNE